MLEVWTVGYETASPDAVAAALQWSRIELLVDVRAVASSRRPGFSKSQLAASIAAVGVGYLHLRGLGTPAEGRLAARTGRHADMRRIFTAHLDTHQAVAELAQLTALVASGTRACLLCFERQPDHCHRSVIADRLRRDLGVTVHHLVP